MAAGHYDRAFPALAKSNRLPPRSSMLFPLAEYHVRPGNVVRVLSLYEDYLRALAGLSQVVSPATPPDTHDTAATDAKPVGVVRTIGFGLGLASLATGTVLLLTVPPAKKTASVGRWVSLNVMKVRADSLVMGMKGAF